MRATDTGASDTINTLVMVRTVCCEGYKQYGQRCAICPNRPENRQAVRDFKERQLAGFRARLSDI